MASGSSLTDTPNRTDAASSAAPELSQHRHSAQHVHGSLPHHDFRDPHARLVEQQAWLTGLALCSLQTTVLQLRQGRTQEACDALAFGVAAIGNPDRIRERIAPDIEQALRGCADTVGEAIQGGRVLGDDLLMVEELLQNLERKILLP